MALSKRTKDILTVAMADKRSSAEVASALSAIQIAAAAAAVAALGSTTNLPATGAVLSTGDTYTDADVKTAIDGAVTALRTPAEARLDAIEAKIDAIIASLKAAGLMSP